MGGGFLPPIPPSPPAFAAPVEEIKGSLFTLHLICQPSLQVRSQVSERRAVTHQKHLGSRNCHNLLRIRPGTRASLTVSRGNQIMIYFQAKAPSVPASRARKACCEQRPRRPEVISYKPVSILPHKNTLISPARKPGFRAKGNLSFASRTKPARICSLGIVGATLAG